MASPAWAVADPAAAARQLGDVFAIGLPALLGPGGRWPAPWALEVLTVPLLAIYALAWLVLLGARARAWRGGAESSPGTGAALDAILALPADRHARLRAQQLRMVRLRASLPPPAGGCRAAPGRRAIGDDMARRAGRGGGRPRRGAARREPGRTSPRALDFGARGALLARDALAFFEARRIPVVATTYWIGPRSAFESGERVIGGADAGRARSLPAVLRQARRDRSARVRLPPGNRRRGCRRAEAPDTSDAREQTRSRTSPSSTTSGCRASTQPRRGSSSRRSSACRLRTHGSGSPPRTRPPGTRQRDLAPRGRARAPAPRRLGGSRSPSGALSGRPASRQGDGAGGAAGRALHPGVAREVSFGEVVRLIGYTLSRADRARRRPSRSSSASGRRVAISMSISTSRSS